MNSPNDFVATAHRMTIATIAADLSVTPRWRWRKRALLRRELRAFRAKLAALEIDP